MIGNPVLGARTTRCEASPVCPFITRFQWNVNFYNLRQGTSLTHSLCKRKREPKTKTETERWCRWWNWNVCNKNEHKIKLMEIQSVERFAHFLALLRIPLSLCVFFVFRRNCLFIILRFKCPNKFPFDSHFGVCSMAKPVLEPKPPSQCGAVWTDCALIVDRLYDNVRYKYIL